MAHLAELVTLAHAGRPARRAPVAGTGPVVR
jgi:hypothetical protein